MTNAVTIPMQTVVVMQTRHSRDKEAAIAVLSVSICTVLHLGICHVRLMPMSATKRLPVNFTLNTGRLENELALKV